MRCAQPFRDGACCVPGPTQPHETLFEEPIKIALKSQVKQEDVARFFFKKRSRVARLCFPHFQKLSNARAGACDGADCTLIFSVEMILMCQPGEKKSLCVKQVEKCG